MALLAEKLRPMRRSGDTRRVTPHTICYNQGMSGILLFCRKYGLVAGADIVHLRAIGAAFAHLPYENVTKILKEAHTAGSMAKLRSAEEVLEDHLRWNTGGTCFSLCNALLALLQSCGYSAYVGMADMHYGANIHCAVIVDLPGGRYLLDPGYLLNIPVPLPENNGVSAIDTPMNVVMLRREAPEVFSLYTREAEEEKWRYRIRTVPTPHDEFVQHWIQSFSLNTMEQVMMSRLDEAGRLYFRKDRLELVNRRERHKTKVNPGAVQELSAAFGLPPHLILEAHRAVLARPS